MFSFRSEHHNFITCGYINKMDYKTIVQRAQCDQMLMFFQYLAISNNES